MTLPYRIHQALAHMRASRMAPPVIPPDAEALLTEPMLHQFRILQPGDQWHLVNVYRFLVDHGAQPDTIVAGLIHDVGKGCMKCRVSIVDRALHIVLGRAIPGPYRRFAARDDVPERLRGLHRLASHARRGALAARQAGYGERVCELILSHENADPEDAELRLLQRADDQADPHYGWMGRR